MSVRTRALGKGQGSRGQAAFPGVRLLSGSPADPPPTILPGVGAPASTTGKDGDIYVDTDTGDAYSKGGGSWNPLAP